MVAVRDLIRNLRRPLFSDASVPSKLHPQVSFVNTVIGHCFHWISSCCSPFIPVMQAVNFSNLNYHTHRRGLNWSQIRRVFVETGIINVIAIPLSK